MMFAGTTLSNGGALGIIVATGTGSSAWMHHATRIPLEDVDRILRDWRGDERNMLLAGCRKNGAAPPAWYTYERAGGPSRAWAAPIPG